MVFSNHVRLINDICCQHYAGHPPVVGSRKLRFQPGDKICSKKNTDVQIESDDTLKEVTNVHAAPSGSEVEKPKEKYKPPDRVNNGDIFFIKAVSSL